MDLKDARRQLEDEGYCVLADLLDAQEAEHIDTLARRTMEPREGYISMETSLNYIPELAPLCIHPTLVELAEEMLGKDFILANNVAMKWCKPGAPSGPLHWGGRFKDIPRLTEFQVFWMLTDFTAENGATLAVPFSHHTGRPPGRNAYPQEIPVVGKKGSVLIFDGRIWHRSGANTTTVQHRMAANMMYLPGTVDRGGEWPLVTRERYDQFPPQLQEMLVQSVASTDTPSPAAKHPCIWTMLDYQEVKHAADGKLATNLTITAGSAFSTAMRFPQASALEVKKTWACWVFPEGTWAIGGNSELELYVDDVKLTHFAVAAGEGELSIQSLAEQVTSRIGDTRKLYNIALKNVGDHDVFIRELWIRWLAS